MRTMILALALILSGCSTLNILDSRHTCLKNPATVTTQEQAEMDYADCDMRTRGGNQHIACMRLKGYRLASCNADGSLASN